MGRALDVAAFLILFAVICYGLAAHGQTASTASPSSGATTALQYVPVFPAMHCDGKMCVLSFGNVHTTTTIMGDVVLWSDEGAVWVIEHYDNGSYIGENPLRHGPAKVDVPPYRAYPVPSTLHMGWRED